MDLDESEEDGGDEKDCENDYSSRVCQLGAAYESDSNVDLDHVIVVIVAGVFFLFPAIFSPCC